MDPESHAFLMLYPLNVLNQVEKFKTKYGLHPFSEITLESLDSLTFVVKTPSVETNDNGKKDSTEISYKDFEHLSGTAKSTALRDRGLCVRCGEEMHLEGEIFHQITTQCHNYQCTGHISEVCGKSRNLRK